MPTKVYFLPRATAKNHRSVENVRYLSNLEARSCDSRFHDRDRPRRPHKTRASLLALDRGFSSQERLREVGVPQLAGHQALAASAILELDKPTPR